MIMMLLALLSWWYTAGWLRVATSAGQRVERVMESFSVGLLAKTLFAPFRQISAGKVQGGFDVQMRALGDRLFSRVFGAFVRSMFIIFGLVSALFVSIVGLIQLVVWPFVPFLPVVGLVLALTGLTL